MASSSIMVTRSVVGPWDVRMPPTKRHMVQKHLVPTIKANFFVQKKRRVTIEIRSPSAVGANGINNSNGVHNHAAWDPVNGTLGDQDSVVFQTFRLGRPKTNGDDTEDHGDDDDMSVSTVGSTNETEFDNGDGSNGIVWRPHQHYTSDSFEITKSSNRTIEVKLGAGNETIVRDIKFHTVDDAEAFQLAWERIRQQEQARTQRQIKKYQKTLKDKDVLANGGDLFGAGLLMGASQVIQEEEDQGVNLLVEIVSATNLPIGDINSSDPYVVVRMKNRELHRTAALPETLNPVWTLATGSLFLVEMTPDEFFSSTAGMSFVIKDHDVVGSNQILGSVTVPLEELLEGKGERKGYKVVLPQKVGGAGVGTVTAPLGDLVGVTGDPTGKSKAQPQQNAVGAATAPVGDFVGGAVERTGYNKVLPTWKHEKKSQRDGELFLRFKKATPEDIKFMHTFKEKKEKFGLYANESFLPVRMQSTKFLHRQGKRGPDHEALRRVRPGPDPDRAEQETKWMTTEQIEAESMKPSTHWIEAGSGDIGKLYFEILGCDNLPNMDATTLNIRDKTDAFSCLVYEDSIVNTDVIGNCLSPRWVPWCQRAFVFNMSHPSSDIYLGLFDYDPEYSPLQVVSRAVSTDLHDPIGRIIIELSKFQANTTYVLKYPLYYGELAEHRKSNRGTVTIRLRLEFPDVRKALVRGLVSPPPTLVSVARQIDYSVAHYTVEGVVDEDKYSINILARYVEELQSYDHLTDYVVKAAKVVWLWRRHFNVKVGDRQIKLPLHSIFAFVWGNLVAWDFNLLPSFLFFAVAWFMLACNEQTRNHPSRWKHSPSYYEFLYRLVTNKCKPASVPTNMDIDLIIAHEEKMEKLRKRTEDEKRREEEHELKLQADLGAGMLETEEAEKVGPKNKDGIFANLNPLKPILYPVQQQLQTIVEYTRIAKSIILWNEAYYAFWLVTLSLAASIVSWWVPWVFLFTWALRIVVFLGLGPWMAMVDRMYFKVNPNMTEEEREAEFKQRLNARYEEALLTATNYQIRKERAIKMRTMQKYMFGKFVLQVPLFHEDFFFDIPLPDSSATPTFPKILTQFRLPRESMVSIWRVT